MLLLSLSAYLQHLLGDSSVRRNGTVSICVCFANSLEQQKRWHVHKLYATYKSRMMLRDITPVAFLESVRGCGDGI